MPDSKRGINDLADRNGWRAAGEEFPGNPHGKWRKSNNSGGRFEYRIDLLPMRARAEIVFALQRDLPGPSAKVKAQWSERWAWFDGLPDRKKAAAREKLDALESVADLVRAGTEKDIAMQLVARQADVSLRTLYNWQDRVAGVPRTDWTRR